MSRLVSAAFGRLPTPFDRLPAPYNRLPVRPGAARPSAATLGHQALQESLFICIALQCVQYGEVKTALGVGSHRFWSIVWT